MRILFFQPNYTGHHFAYLARMLPGFFDLPVEITVATTNEALESQEFSRTLDPLAERMELVACCTPPPVHPVANARHRLHDLVRAIGAVRPDHVMVCYADGIWDQAALAALVGRRPWRRELVVEGWIYRGRFGDPADRRFKSAVRRWLFKRLLRQGLFRRLHLDHELLYEFGIPRAAGTPTELVLAPNPIVVGAETSMENARRELGIAVDGQWISLSGVIARFKGAHLLLEAYGIYRGRNNNGLRTVAFGRTPRAGDP